MEETVLNEQNKDYIKEFDEFVNNFIIITKRPDNMSFQEYKEYLKLQDKIIKFKKRSKLIYLSSELTYDKMNSFIKRFEPFVGKTKDLY